MRPLTWALKEIDPVVLHKAVRQMKLNAFKFKIAPHKQKSKKDSWQEDGPLGQRGTVLKHT